METYESLVQKHRRLTITYKKLSEAERLRYGADMMDKIQEIEKQLKLKQVKHS
jgi:hypothetical protein